MPAPPDWVDGKESEVSLLGRDGVYRLPRGIEHDKFERDAKETGKLAGQVHGNAEGIALGIEVCQDRVAHITVMDARRIPLGANSLASLAWSFVMMLPACAISVGLCARMSIQ